MSESAGPGPARPLRFVLASIVGNALEWYDFFLFAAASALIFGTLFAPPGESVLAGLLWSFGTYAVGFAARPLGGLLFGSLGDRHGRTVALQWTLALMGLSTFAIGLLPTYADVGIWALFLLVGLRIAQGLAAGGEWGGAVLLIAENSPAGRRGYLTAWSKPASGSASYSPRSRSTRRVSFPTTIS